MRDKGERRELRQGREGETVWGDGLSREGNYRQQLTSARGEDDEITARSY